MLTFKAIHGNVPTILSDRFVMDIDVNGYDTRGANFMNAYLPTVHKEIYKLSFLNKGGALWNELPDYVKDSETLLIFKRNYASYKAI